VGSKATSYLFGGLLGFAGLAQLLPKALALARKDEVSGQDVELRAQLLVSGLEGMGHRQDLHAGLVLRDAALVSIFDEDAHLEGRLRGDELAQALADQLITAPLQQVRAPLLPVDLVLRVQPVWQLYSVIGSRARARFVVGSPVRIRDLAETWRPIGHILARRERRGFDLYLLYFIYGNERRSPDILFIAIVLL
jgi:hypothetical protein